ncbi:hypothetical protein DPEC_G00135320 [Dallia pectoralis]|uniref:Uncharacterized protein n=1 Tax=Dallia pectoralis TaxID=75939 RepID=A0ACC2GLR2_DALPE|nr:hypothetical protein DPEC_G00135320 [Dallia pectoralis]
MILVISDRTDVYLSIELIGHVAMAGSGAQKCPKSEKLEEAQELARRCAGRPDFCTTHSHGKCFKLHWCCHLGWCHCKYVYQPMTNVCHLPNTLVPSDLSDLHQTMNLSVSLTERFLRTSSCFQAPPSEDSGINALGLNFLESCESEEDERSTDGDENSRPACGLWDQENQENRVLMAPYQSLIEIIENIETTV